MRMQEVKLLEAIYAITCIEDGILILRIKNK